MGAVTGAACGDDASSPSGDGAGGATGSAGGSGGVAQEGSGGAGSSSARASSSATGSAASTTASTASGESGGGGQGGGEGGGPSELHPRLDAIQMKASHNSYQRDEAHFDIFAYHRVRAIELDIHVDKTSWDPMPGDWFVYHADIVEPETTCHRMRDCLGELVAFDRAVPDHEVAVVFVDLKEDTFGGTQHAPADLDALFESVVGRDRIFTPDDLVATCPQATTPREAVGACGWPRTDSLRGKLVFALTGGTMCEAGGKLRRYADEGALAFVAPALEGGCPDVDAYADEPQAVWINIPSESASLATGVAAAGLVSRVYGLNDEATWNVAQAAGANVLATDKVNFEVDPWARTHNDRGWPFACKDGGCESFEEPSPPTTLVVTSGDLWSDADDGVMATQSGIVDETDDQAAISTRNSHVEPFAKGCLVARASTAPGAASFAVCRPADQHVVRVQVRAQDGDDTVAHEVDVVARDTVDQESLPFVRLAISGPAASPTARGYGSLDGLSWTLIAEHAFGSPLPVRGIAAGGHDAGEAVRFLFASWTRTVSGAERAPVLIESLTFSALAGGSGSVFVGALPP